MISTNEMLLNDKSTYCKYEDLVTILKDGKSMLLAGGVACGKSYTANMLSIDVPNIAIFDPIDENIEFDLLYTEKPLLATIQADRFVKAITSFSFEHNISIKNVLIRFDYVVLPNRAAAYEITASSIIRETMNF